MIPKKWNSLVVAEEGAARMQPWELADYVVKLFVPIFSLHLKDRFGSVWDSNSQCKEGAESCPSINVWVFCHEVVGLYLAGRQWLRGYSEQAFAGRTLAISQRLQILGFIFRSDPPTFVGLASDRFYQLSHFLMVLHQIFKLDRPSFAHYTSVLLINLTWKLMLW